MPKKLVLENTAPFQGLPELVAYNEGLFAAEGLEIEWVDRTQNAPKAADRGITDPNVLSSLSNHGAAMEAGKAGMFNACECGNFRRSQDSSVGGKQVGRRAILVYGALIVPPWSDVYTPQQLAGKTVGLPYFAGTHYLVMQMLEGFLPRDQINTCLAPNGSRKRLDALLAGEVDATTVTEPYITVARKEGCRVIVLAPYHGTEVATDEVDPEAYAAFSRAVKEAVRRINADKPKYARYFIDHHKDDPRVAALTVDDFDLGLLQVMDPAPIPEEELRRTYEWMRSWNMLSETTEWEDLVLTTDFVAAAHGS